MSAKSELLQQMALAAGWVNANGQFITERAPDLYAAAQSIGANYVDVDAAFAFDPGTAERFVIEQGWAPLTGSVSRIWWIGGAALLGIVLLGRRGR